MSTETMARPTWNAAVAANSRALRTADGRVLQDLRVYGTVSRDHIRRQQDAERREVYLRNRVIITD